MESAAPPDQGRLGSRNVSGRRIMLDALRVFRLSKFDNNVSDMNRLPRQRPQHMVFLSDSNGYSELKARLPATWENSRSVPLSFGDEGAVLY